MGIKDAFLNKGWAGRTIDRRATIERLNPLIRMHHELNHAYNHAINRVSDAETAGRLEAFQRIARADIGKLSESVLSAGGVAYNGLDLETGGDDGDDEKTIIRRLRDSEEAFQRRLKDELGENHQIRSRAILAVVLGNSSDRLEYLGDITKTRTRSR